MNLVFATHNKNKVQEIQSILGNKHQINSLTEIGIFDEIEENAKSIEDNSRLKANYIWNRFKLNCFADDTGLEIEALNGEPGVFSARYAGEEKNDNANIQKVLDKLGNITQRNARFKTVITLIFNGNDIQFTGIVNGTIGFQKKGLNGFGYDPIFYPEKENRTFAEMTLTEKNKYSHRAKAFSQLVEYLNSQM